MPTRLVSASKARRPWRAFVVCTLLGALTGAPHTLVAQAVGDTAAAMALYRKAARTFAAAKTIRAQFEQTLISPVNSTPRVSRGEMLQRPPDRFAFRFSEPAGDAVIADGEALWIYLPSTAKGQVLKMPRELGGAFDIVARLLANPGDRTQVSVLPEVEHVGGETVTQFALTPRAGGAPFQTAKVWIGADAVVRQLEIEEPGGLRRRLRFSSMKLGAPLPRNAFVFTVPTGARVIDQQALLGPGAPRLPKATTPPTSKPAAKP